jgi:LysM repeat protein
VRRGETLSTIAEKYDLATRDVQSWNQITNAARIRVGQVLSLRAPAASSSGSSAGLAAGTPVEGAPRDAVVTTYVVRRGDTLSEIAERFDIGATQLKSWNGISDPRSLRVGDKLKIRGQATSSPEVRMSSYTVRNGDTLSEIAEHLGVRTSEIKAWNGITDPRSLRVGQTLTVRGVSSGWQTHLVASGETLGGIAKRFSVSISDLRSWNNISGSTIHPGQSLKIRRDR